MSGERPDRAAPAHAGRGRAVASSRPGHSSHRPSRRAGGKQGRPSPERPAPTISPRGAKFGQRLASPSNDRGAPTTVGVHMQPGDSSGGKLE